MRPPKKLQTLVGCLLWAVFAIAVPRCIFSQQPEAADTLRLHSLTGVRGGSLTVAVSSYPTNFNRMLASGLSNVAIAERLFADLVHVNRITMELEPSLATAWEVDKTGKVYTIHLRRGIRFSNNTPFNADDVLFTFQVLKDPKTACVMAGQIETDGTYPAVIKVDEYTIRLTFQRPVGMGLRMLDSIPILPRKTLLKAYQEGRFAEAWGPNVNPADVVGLGPFRLKEYQHNVRVVLERNPYYWKKDKSGQALPYLDSVVFLVIPDLDSHAMRFGQGELDLLNSPSLTPENYARLRRSPGAYTLRDLGSGLTMEFLWFNLNRDRSQESKNSLDPEKQAIFEKAEFRRAISFALDRKGIVKSIFLGLGTPQYGPLSTGNKVWADPAIPRTDYNPAHARKLLAQAGLSDSNRDGFLEYGSRRQAFTINLLTTRGNTAREKLAQVIQDNLGKIGIRVSIQHLLTNEIASRFLNSFDYEAILFAFSPTDVAPDLQTDLWYSSGKLHFWCPNQDKPIRPWEAAMDALVTGFLKKMDPAARKADFNRVQNLWAREMPAISTVAPNILVGWSNRLINIRPSILTPHLLWNVEAISRQR